MPTYGSNLAYDMGWLDRTESENQVMLFQELT